MYCGGVATANYSLNAQFVSFLGSQRLKPNGLGLFIFAAIGDITKNRKNHLYTLSIETAI